MKTTTLTFILIATLALARAASVPEAMTPEDDDQEDQRDKRALGFLADKITSKFASKLGWAGPPGHPPPQHELEYGPPISYHTKNFDIWAFKKAILNALFQAVKAIKGGIIAVKGQILKAKGHLLQTKGHILAAKGDAITNFGRQVAAKSLLDPSVLYDGPVHSHIDLSGPGGYGSASTAALKESAPPPLPTKATIEPSPSYAPLLPTPDSYGPFKEEPKEAPKDYAQGGLPNGVQAGLLVLKPIGVPSSDGGLSGNFAEPPGSYESPQYVPGNAPNNYEYSAGSFGGGAEASFGGGAGSFGGYAGPLSPATYESFGGHGGDLSASFTQSAVQSNQKKRGSAVPQTRQQQQHHAPPPPPQYRQVVQGSAPQYHSVQPRLVPQRNLHPRAAPPFTLLSAAPPRGFHLQRPPFGQRLL